MTELKGGGHLRKACSLAGHSPAWRDDMAAGGMRRLSRGICSREAEGEDAGAQLTLSFFPLTLSLHLFMWLWAQMPWACGSQFSPIVWVLVRFGSKHPWSHLTGPFSFSLVFLGIEPTTSCVGDKRSITEPQPQNSFPFYFETGSC